VFEADKLSALAAGFSLHRVVVVTSLFIVAYSGFTVVGNAERSFQLSAQTRQLQQAIAHDQSDYAQLDGLRRYMRSDAFIEAEARQEGLGSPGDTAIVVVAPTAPPSERHAAGAAWWERYFGR
jgi:cell division protein FtsB